LRAGHDAVGLGSPVDGGDNLVMLFRFFGELARSSAFLERAGHIKSAG
jgi:hypothetical protein